MQDSLKNFNDNLFQKNKAGDSENYSSLCAKHIGKASIKRKFLNNRLEKKNLVVIQ